LSLEYHYDENENKKKLAYLCDFMVKPTFCVNSRISVFSIALTSYT